MSEFDFSLSISFNLAAKIGLEETVLLSYLQQQSYVLQSKTMRFEMAQLVAQLPFWTPPMMLRILSSLQLNHCLTFQRNESVLELVLLGETGRSSAVKESLQPQSQGQSIDSAAFQYDPLMHKMDKMHAAAKQRGPDESLDQAKKTLRTQPLNQVPVVASAPSRVTNERRRGVTDFDLYLEQKERTRQPDQWQPEEATLEQIAQAGITRQFALQLQPEFLLRIKEQRKNVRTWNSEFFKYVKRQWQYKQPDRSSNEGTSSSKYPSKTTREQVSDALTNIHDTDW